MELSVPPGTVGRFLPKNVPEADAKRHLSRAKRHTMALCTVLYDTKHHVCLVHKPNPRMHRSVLSSQSECSQYDRGSLLQREGAPGPPAQSKQPSCRQPPRALAEKNAPIRSIDMLARSRTLKLAKKRCSILHGGEIGVRFSSRFLTRPAA